MVQFIDNGNSTDIDGYESEDTLDIDAQELELDDENSEPFEGFIESDDATTVDRQISPELRKAGKEYMVQLRKPESGRGAKRTRSSRNDDLYSTDVISQWMVDPFHEK